MDATGLPVVKKRCHRFSSMPQKIERFIYNWRGDALKKSDEVE